MSSSSPSASACKKPAAVVAKTARALNSVYVFFVGRDADVLRAKQKETRLPQPHGTMAVPDRASGEKKSVVRLIRYKYICLGIVLLNLVYSFVLCLTSPTFARVVSEYSVFCGLYLFAIVTALFGILDRKDMLLYPFLVMNFPLALLAAIIFCFHVLNAYYCAIAEDSTSDEDSEVGYVDKVPSYSDCSLLSRDATGWRAVQLSLVTAFAFLLLAFEKLAESLLLRSYQRQLMQAKWHDTVGLSGSRQDLRVSDIVGEDGDHDTDDDDMIVYERATTRNNNNAFRVREVPVQDPPFGANGTARTLA